MQFCKNHNHIDLTNALSFNSVKNFLRLQYQLHLANEH